MDRSLQNLKSGHLHYLILKNVPGKRLFFDSSDHKAFGEILTRALAMHAAQIHAFHLTASIVHLAVGISSAAMTQFAKRISGSHARRLNTQHAMQGHLFGRHEAIALGEESRLLDLVRYIHLVPVQSGGRRRHEALEWSSHRAYLGIEKIPWLTTDLVFRQLTRQVTDRRESYRELMSRTPGQKFATPDAQGTEDRKSEANFYAWLSSSSLDRPAVTLEQIIDAVAIKLNASRPDISLRLRHRKLSLARALIVWFATQNDIATLAEVSRRLDRHPSSLCVSRDHYRTVRPDLFQMSLAELMAETLNQPG